WPAKLEFLVERSGYWPDDYSEMEEEPKNDVLPKNVIYYGPPGTGKTFELQSLLQSGYTDQENGDRYTFITFHQSYGYEEFVEGLRPVLDRTGESGQIQYEIREGVFKDLCRRARLTPDQRFAMVIDEINRG